MSTITLGPGSGDFVWASGIENTFVPQVRPRHRALDEYQLMGHYEHWREDLALAREVGVKALRWGVPWYRVEPLPGEFDWRWTDEVLPYIVNDLGITPIVDLMHYGCPFWMRREFANEDYPQAVAAYAAAFAERYGSLVEWYTPLNEPLVNAMLCGMEGAWPPYCKGEKGYVRIIMQLARGIEVTVRALKEVNPAARMVHVEAASIYHSSDPALEHVLEEQRLKNFIVYDLITGRVTPEHPLFNWLLRSGARPRDLEAVAANPVAIDVMGLNFYPQWSTQELYLDEKGRAASRVVERDGAGFGEMVRGYYMRYGVPIIITETSAKDSETARSEWLHSSLRMIKQLRSEGVPVLGYTWFPLFTMVDWRYRWGRGPLQKYLIDLGLYRVDPTVGANNVRSQAFPLAAEFKRCVDNAAEVVGEMAVG